MTMTMTINEDAFEYQVFETYYAAIGTEDAPSMVEALVEKYGSLEKAFIAYPDLEIKYVPGQRKWAEVVAIVKANTKG